MQRFPIAMGLALMLAMVAPAQAGEGHGSFELPFEAELDGTVLAAGEYDISWQASGPQASVSVLDEDGEVLVTTTANIKQLDSKTDAYVRRYDKPDGSHALAEVGLQGKRFALRFEQSLARVKSETKGMARR